MSIELYDRFYHIAQQYAQQPALHQHNASLSYGDLLEQVEQCAKALAGHLSPQQRCVALYLDGSVQYVIALLALLKLRVAFVPLGTGYPAQRSAAIVQQLGIELLIGHQPPHTASGEQPWVELGPLHSLKNCGVLWQRPGATPGVQPLPEDDLAYVLSTSGSTGQPKLILGSHKGLAQFIHWMIAEFAPGPQWRYSALAPVTFDVSLRDILLPLLSGGSVYIADDSLRQQPQQLLRWLSQHRIQWMHIVPTLFRTLMQALHDSDTAPPLALSHVVLAGEALRTEDVQHWHQHLQQSAQLINLYGPSETTLAKLFYVIPPDLSAPPAIVPLGRPMPDCEVLIVDEQSQLCPAGQVGELCLSTPYASHGYFNASAQQQQAFTQLMLHGRQYAVYRSGDLVHQDEQGLIHFHQRKDFQVKLNGQRVELLEIEARLCAHPQITQAVVTLVPEHLVPGALALSGDKLAAYLVAAAPIAVDQLREFLALSLPAYMLPSYYCWLDHLPTNANGKVDRAQLPTPTAQRPLLSQAYMPAQTPLQQQIALVFAQVLQLSPVGLRDNFFDLGGTSLQVTQVATLLQQQLDIAISLPQLFDHPSVRQLANLIESTQQSSAATPVRRPQAKSGDIAIVGMACRLPKADDLQAFWQHLLNQHDCITRFDDSELDPSIAASLSAQPHYIKARGVIERAQDFDADFFGIAAREADILDPQQRLLIELSHLALHDAAIDPQRFEGLIGVWAGVGDNRYFSDHLLNHDICELLGEHRLRLANEKDYVASRIAYALNLRGMAISVHTACSTSLVAIVQGMQALRAGTLDAVLCGGAYIALPQHSGYLATEGGFNSMDGYCRPFDHRASGTVFSSGGGMVVLKRAEDARAAGDPIYALIKGGAVNNDGGGKMSFMAPSVQGQAQVIRMAVADAGIDAAQVRGIEAHGTATPLGDPIEVEALAQVYGRAAGAAAQSEPCWLGSLKGNMGHLDAGAGVAGVIKAALSLHRCCLPASIHYEQPNAHIPFADYGLAVNTQARALGDTPGYLAVSALGVGGTNAHVILGHEPAAQPSPAASRYPYALLCLSAHTPAVLATQSQVLAQYLSGDAAKSVDLTQVAYTLALGRAALAQRRFVLCQSAQQACTALAQPSQGYGRRPVDDDSDTPVVFMFPGQGCQYVGMGAELYAHSEVFRAAIDRCADLLGQTLPMDLRRLLYPQTDAQHQQAQQWLQQTHCTQPALFAVGYALAQHWLEWGIRPTALIGHSIGEYVAACLAGVFSLPTALQLVAQRGQLMQALPPGVMLSVSLDEASLRALLPEQVDIAAINGPQRCVAAGPEAAIIELEHRLQQQSIKCKRLHTSHAFHSQMMAPIQAPFAEQVAQAQPQAPQIPIVSTATGAWLSDAQAQNPQYWSDHLRQPVRFAQAVHCVWQQQPDAILLELGPRATACQLARAQATDPVRQQAIPSLPDAAKPLADWHSLLGALGQMWAEGVPIDWQRIYPQAHPRLSLPSQPFAPVRHWIDPPGLTTVAAVESSRQPVEADDPIDHLTQRLSEVIGAISGRSLSDDLYGLSFFELGLDSLVMTQLALALKQRFNLNVSLQQLGTQLCSIEQLAQAIRVQGAPTEPADTPTAVSLEAKLTGPVLPLDRQVHLGLRTDLPEGARLGRDPQGNPGWYVPLPDQPQVYARLPVNILLPPTGAAGDN